MSQSLKRVIDVAISAVISIVAAPAMIAIAIAVRVFDGSPIIFTQERVGLHGQSFRILKFRTMTTKHQGPAISPSGDSRVTALGAYLRRIKLDELPQLFNVLRGDMSLVGPRPEVPDYVALWPARDRSTILAVRPGITDPASLAYRNEAEMLASSADPHALYEEVILPRKCSMYVDYVRNQTMLGDLMICIRTALAVIGRDDATASSEGGSGGRAL